MRRLFSIKKKKGTIAGERTLIYARKNLKKIIVKQRGDEKCSGTSETYTAGVLAKS
jgi:hypothetical protein